MAGESGGVATVLSQEGDRVHLALPMVGFPPGFELRPGDRVVVVNEDTGPAVRPLVQSRILPVDSRALARRGRLEVEGRTYVVPEAAVIRDEEGEGAAAGEHVVWLVADQGEGEPERVIAARPARRGDRR